MLFSPLYFKQNNLESYIHDIKCVIYVELYVSIYLEISIYPYVETLNHRVIEKIPNYKTSAEQSVFKEEKIQMKC